MTWILLITGIVLRRTGVTDLGVSVAGPLHGFAFLAYCAVTLLVAVNQQWRLVMTIVALAASVIPLATVFLDRRLERRGMLEGPWRRESAAGAAAGGGLDRMLRVVLARPAVSAVLVVAAVVAAFSALLVVGPPRLPG